MKLVRLLTSNLGLTINYCVTIGEVLKLQVRIAKVIKTRASAAINSRSLSSSLPI